MDSIKDSLFKETLRLLRLPPESRTSRDIEILMEATAGVEFFRSFKDIDSSDEVHRECVKVMTLQYCRANEIIFNYGDSGDCFYVLLKGQVSIQTPNFNVVTESLETADVSKEDTGLLPRINRRFSALAKRLVTSDEPLPSQKPQEENQDYENETSVKYKEEGYSFGELSLLTSQPRAADIKCTKESWVARLSRDDYMRILKGYEEKKLGEMVKMLKSLQIFENWTRYSIVKITYLFDHRRYVRNQVVYRYKDQADQVFIIKSGEFRFSYTVVEREEGLLNQRRLVKNKQLQMFTKGVHEMFGEDDVIEGKSRSLNCVCISLVGEVIVMEKNDFLRRLQVVPSTWDIIMARYNNEKQWRSARIEKLQMTELLRKRIGSLPRVQVTDNPIVHSSRPVISHTVHKPRSSSVSQDLPLSEVVPATGFFETQVLEFEDDSQDEPTLKQESQGTKTLVKIKNRSSSPRKGFSFSQHAAPSKPPPNFFVDPYEAIRSRYKFRPLITGRDEDSMNLIDRSFYRMKAKRLRQKAKTYTVQLADFLLP